MLEVQYKGKNIHEVLQMTVKEALRFFAGQTRLLEKLAVLDEVGLGYLRLGQSATTLSGGEAQRVKLAAHLAQVRSANANAKPSQASRVLYILDEPTTGLHFDDVSKLLTAFRKLIDGGGSLIVIEHNLDVIKSADWVIDLGPEGGEGGGQHRRGGHAGGDRRRTCIRIRGSGWHGHCNEGSGNPKNQFFACAVSRGVGDQGYRPVFQIEVYLPDGHKLILEPGGAIREWHLWNDYRQISVSFDTRYAHQAHALYDARTGKLLRQLNDPADPSQLPQWAKSRLQIDNESVPMDQRSQEMRNRWITKALIQIGTIKPGMHRRDLDTLFRMDGGLQFNSDTGRYDLKECPSIKVDVHFVSRPKSEPLSRSHRHHRIHLQTLPRISIRGLAKESSASK